MLFLIPHILYHFRGLSQFRETSEGNGRKRDRSVSRHTEGELGLREDGSLVKRRKWEPSEEDKK